MVWFCFPIWLLRRPCEVELPLLAECEARVPQQEVVESGFGPESLTMEPVTVVPSFRTHPGQPRG